MRIRQQQTANLKMSVRPKYTCSGITLKKNKCKCRVKTYGALCYYHKNQAIAIDLILDDDSNDNEIENSDVCKCCFEEITINREVKCSSNSEHVFCGDCVDGYVKSNLTKGIATYCCMFHSSDNCGGTYKAERVLDSISDVITRNQFIETHLIYSTAQLASVLDNFCICPHCKKYGVIRNTDDIILQCEYNACRRRWCIKCNGEHDINHQTNSCLKAVNEDNYKTFIDNLITNSILHKCPSCFTAFVKDDGDGCNCMTCPKCNTHSCYVCYEKLPKDDYYRHFGSGRCPLFNVSEQQSNNENTRTIGNRQFHEDKIISACRNLVAENLDRHELCQKMSDYIVNVHKINIHPQNPNSPRRTFVDRYIMCIPRTIRELARSVRQFRGIH